MYKHREAEMRQVSEKTNARVAWFSIMSLGVCIGASVLQVWYLKRFFHKKKLI
ncbi:putative transmembrane emp24 domain-containing protein [Helianthus annuus]|nr:putative transmembrane emp24 domain-containing protein [Helianthus annuus]KAJ0760738.1 putative transmembrane emp24 domain-containing protein [Helianthus annuus]